VSLLLGDGLDRQSGASHEGVELGRAAGFRLGLDDHRGSPFSS
jgi:hypothetical protein